MEKQRILKDIEQLCEQYGFEARSGIGQIVFGDPEHEYDIIVYGDNTDGELVEWFAYDYDEQYVSYVNTDHNNMWLCETRPDLSGKQILAFLKQATFLMDEPDMPASAFIDPEDWQEMTGCASAMSDLDYRIPLSQFDEDFLV